MAARLGERLRSLLAGIGGSQREREEASGAETERSAEQVVDSMFRELLRRAPEPAAIEFYSPKLSSGELTAADLAIQLSQSEEFLAKSLARKDLSFYKLGHLGRSAFVEIEDPRHRALDYEGAFSVGLFEEIFVDALSRNDADAYREYCHVHKQRLYETYCFLKEQLSDGEKSVCEVSTSPFSVGLKKSFPCRYVSVDHPPLYPGCDGTPNTQLASDLHISVDLNVERLSERRRSVNEAEFDLILFCEILEHLLKSPYDLLLDLHDCLKPGGLVYVTTPNFFSHERLARIMHRQHPNAVLQAGESYASGGPHVREYTMGELIEILERTGFEVVHFSYSDCWDRSDELRGFLDRYPDERTCLVAVGRKS